MTDRLQAGQTVRTSVQTVPLFCSGVGISPSVFVMEIVCPVVENLTTTSASPFARNKAPEYQSSLRFPEESNDISPVTPTNSGTVSKLEL